MSHCPLLEARGSTLLEKQVKNAVEASYRDGYKAAISLARQSIQEIFYFREPGDLYQKGHYDVMNSLLDNLEHWEDFIMKAEKQYAKKDQPNESP